MKALIIDNEEDVIQSLKLLIAKYCSDIEIVGVAMSCKAAKLLLHASEVDLVFLDIELGDGTGLEVLQSHPKRDFEVIFITAHSHYAVQAFQFSAIDYLLKPFDPERLLEAVARARVGVQQSAKLQQLEALVENLQSNQLPRRLVLRDMDNIHLFELDDLLYATAEGSYTRLFFKEEREWLSSKNLKYFEGVLKKGPFFRTHQSYLVNLNHVLRFERVEGGSLVLQTGQHIPVAVRRQKLLVEQLMRLQ
ncbi:MAG: LytTR family DNA-binding domain-containing protein [Saprospiraceae bacterium]|nr:LytTR family DNA-binding domain-containing protein [Saprospiraceae bacterium]